MPKREERCETCRWWFYHERSCKDYSEKGGMVWRGNNVWWWENVCHKTPSLPHREADDWCGEWEAREDKREGEPGVITFPADTVYAAGNPAEEGAGESGETGKESDALGHCWMPWRGTGATTATTQCARCGALDDELAARKPCQGKSNKPREDKGTSEPEGKGDEHDG